VIVGLLLGIAAAAGTRRIVRAEGRAATTFVKR
jgi:hypothetical protein